MRLSLIHIYYPAEALAAFLRERRERFPQLPAEELFSGSLQSRLGKTVLKRAGIAMAEPLGSVGDARIDDLCKLVKAFPLSVTGVKLSLIHISLRGGAAQRDGRAVV